RGVASGRFGAQPLRPRRRTASAQGVVIPVRAAPARPGCSAARGIRNFRRASEERKGLLSLIECVPNFSEGRDLKVVSTIAQAIADVDGVALLGFESDADHHR